MDSNATFVAFTGTPISHDDKDTQAVFGEYVDIYDIQQAVEDGATYRFTMSHVLQNRTR